MKNRFAQEKNDLSETREEKYKTDSMNIAYELGFELIERDTKVSKIEGNLKTLICPPVKPKTLLYETWRNLRKLHI